MKKIKSISFIFLLLIIYIYVAYVSLLPNTFIFFEGETININTIFGINIVNLEENVLQTSKNLSESNLEANEKKKLSVNLFNQIPLKQVEVNVLKKTKVVPLGNAIGLKLYTKGVMVVGMSEIQGEDKKSYKPYENTGIKEGDMIISIDDKEVTCISELIDTVNKSNGDELVLKYIRQDELSTTNIKPIKSTDNEYKLGLWVRDARSEELEQ